MYLSVSFTPSNSWIKPFQASISFCLALFSLKWWMADWPASTLCDHVQKNWIMILSFREFQRKFLSFNNKSSSCQVLLGSAAVWKIEVFGFEQFWKMTNHNSMTSLWTQPSCEHEKNDDDGSSLSVSGGRVSKFWVCSGVCVHFTY